MKNGWFYGTCSNCTNKNQMVHKIFSSQICMLCARHVSNRNLQSKIKQWTFPGFFETVPRAHGQNWENMQCNYIPGFFENCIAFFKEFFSFRRIKHAVLVLVRRKR